VREFIAISKALSDPSRVRILLALRGGELCVCQLVELLGLAPSTVSKHLAILRQAYLVDCHRDGRWAYYRRAGREGSASVRAALRWVDASLADDPGARSDARKLEEIQKSSPQELCTAGVDR
jgi:DNA-binding transcriptional ArsR family regulator